MEAFRGQCSRILGCRILQGLGLQRSGFGAQRSGFLFREVARTWHRVTGASRNCVQDISHFEGFGRVGLLSLCLLLMLPLLDSGQLNQSHLHRQRHHDTHEVDED